MNPLVNPLFLYKILKSYFSDPDRLRKISNQDLKKYQDKSVRKLVKYAYSIPVYKDKYSKINIKPDDIKSVNDLKKLPLITKDDLRKYSPDGITPQSFNKENALGARTGGTTGTPLILYLDSYSVVKSMIGLIRTMNEYGIDWRRTKMSLLLDLTESSFESSYFMSGVSSFIKPFFSQKNMQVINQLETPTDLIKKVEDFKPELLAGYPSMINILAILKERGHGKKLNPKLIMTAGQFLESNGRRFLEETFKTKIYDSYISTETGPIAYECKNGNYHVHSDLIYPEFLKNGEDIDPGEPGEFIITKLQGFGTPLIRYNGLGDIVTESDRRCNCGIIGSQIKCIHGRKYNSILLPDGRMVTRSFMEEIFSEIFLKSKVNKQNRSQIVQHKLDKIEIKIEFDKELRNVGSPPEELFKIMKKKMQDQLGTDIEIFFTEVDKFDEKALYLVSKIDRSKFIEKSYVI